MTAGLTGIVRCVKNGREPGKLVSFRKIFYGLAMPPNIALARGRPRASHRDAAFDAPRMLKLIEAAEDIFLAKGYHGATMDDVAKAAGMSKKTVYQLIDSKAKLFVELLAHYQTLLKFPATRPEWSCGDILVENLLCLARFLLAPEQISIIRLIMAEYTHSPDLGRLFHEKRVMKARTRLEICLRDIARQRGATFRNGREMAAMLFGMALGEFQLGTLLGFRAAPGRAVLERRIRAAVELFLLGCGDLDAKPR